MGYNKFKSKRKDYMDDTMYSDKSLGPNPEGNLDYKIGLKARRNLPKSTYSIKADPYEASIPTANPYDLIAPFNKTVGGMYAGADNLDGGNVQQYANSYNSKTLKAFDFSLLKLAVNYRYIPRLLAQANVPTVSGSDVTGYTTNYVGEGLIDMQRQAIAEATSVLQATTFTQMAINYYAVETDMPMGKAEFTVIDGKAINQEIADVIYLGSSFYQIFWQEVNSLVSWFNSFRLKQGTMIRSSWNRETPTLNSLFGLFNKKAFLSLFDSICLSFEGEYFDSEWASQFNTLTLMPSRRTNSIHDPVLEVQARHQVPKKFKLFALNEQSEIIDTIFNLETDLTFVDPDDQETNLTVFEIIDEIKDLFAATNVMRWARDPEHRLNLAQNAYYNRVVKLLNLVQESCTIMKIKFNDLREVYDVISRTGLNSWVKKYRPSITKDTDAALFDNLIINDIYKTVFSGAVDIELDPSTKRWRSYTMWDMYDGVPAFDAQAGGCFLTFSGKKVITNSDADHIEQWLPIAFYIDSTDETISGVSPKLTLVNRSGDAIDVSVEEITMYTDPVLARLVPLPSQAGDKIRVPKVTGTLEAHVKSFLTNTLCSIFGIAKVGDQINLDPDLLYIYEIELYDITNDSIRYARMNSPFRGAYPEGDLIGFKNFGQQ